MPSSFFLGLGSTGASKAEMGRWRLGGVLGQGGFGGRRINRWVGVLEWPTSGGSSLLSRALSG